MKRIILAFVLWAAFASVAWAVEFYSVKRANITTTSVDVDFGFPAAIIMIYADPTNTDEVCIDFAGGSAVCPAANTAGDKRLPAGGKITVDGYGAQHIGVIAASGTLTVFIDAYGR